MFADDVLSLLKDSWVGLPRKSGTISVFSNPALPSIDRIEFVSRLGDLEPGERERLRRDVFQLIESDLSNIVCGAYTYNNFTERPESACFFVYEKVPTAPKLSLIGFFRQSDLNLSSAMEISGETLQFASDLLNSRPSVFIFAAGVQISEHVSQVFQSHRQSHNVVFNLPAFRTPKPVFLSLKYRYTFFNRQQFPIAVEGLSSQELEDLTKLNDFYHYGKTPDEMCRFVHTQAHVVIYDFEAGKVCAAARANSTTPKFSVIGGVVTSPKHRRRGLGYFMCAKLTEFLLGESERVSLETDVGNFPARNIYEGMGFTPCGRSVFIDRNTDMIPKILGERDY